MIHTGRHRIRRVKGSDQMHTWSSAVRFTYWLAAVAEHRVKELQAQGCCAPFGLSFPTLLRCRTRGTSWRVPWGVWESGDWHQTCALSDDTLGQAQEFGSIMVVSFLRQTLLLLLLNHSFGQFIWKFCEHPNQQRYWWLQIRCHYASRTRREIPRDTHSCNVSFCAWLASSC